MKYRSLVSALALCLLAFFVLTKQSFAVTATPTPLPPESTALEDVKVFTGTGESVLDVSEFREASLMRVWAYESHGTISLSSSAGDLGFIFESTPFYSEYVLNYFIDKSSAEIKISSRGEWRVEISPLSHAKKLVSPGSLQGVGETVVVVEGEPSSSINVQTDGTDSISINAYNNTKTYLIGSEAAVNAVVSIAKPIKVLTVRSKGEWLIATGDLKETDPVTKSDSITSTVVATKTATIKKPIPTSTPVPTNSPTSTRLPMPTGTLTTQQMQDYADTVTFKDLARNTEKYVGKLLKYEGKVIQVIEDSGDYQLRVDVTKDEYDNWSDTVFLICPQCPTRPLEDDIVSFVAAVDGRLTYQSTMGSTITLPQLTARVFDVITDK